MENNLILLDIDSKQEINKVKKFSRVKILEMAALLLITNVMFYAKSDEVFTLLYAFSVIFVSGFLLVVFGYHVIVRIPNTFNKIIKEIVVKDQYYEICTLPYNFLWIKKKTYRFQTKTLELKDRREEFTWLKTKSLKINFTTVVTDIGTFIVLTDYMPTDFLNSLSHSKNFK